jgi:hypothetical protein
MCTSNILGETENAPGTPSDAFLPVLRNGVTQEYLHFEALKEAGGKPLATKYWFPDAALGNGGIGVFETLEVIQTIEISLYLIGVSAYSRRGDDIVATLEREGIEKFRTSYAQLLEEIAQKRHQPRVPA